MSPALRDRLLDAVTLRVTVTEAEPVAARMRRLRLASPQLVGAAWQPGQQVRVHPDPASALLRRTYSVWWFDAAAGELDLCVLDHPEAGPGARWGREARPGDAVRLGRPEGGFTLRPDAAHHLFVGEETASAAFGPMLAALPPDASVAGAVETLTPADRLPLPAPHADALTWTLRDPARPLPAVVAQLPDAAYREGAVAYVAGEARTVQQVRQTLTGTHGWPRRAVLTKPFWTPGRRGLD